MELNTILNILADKRNGIAIKCHLITEVKGSAKAKKENVTITKDTVACVRKGIEYDKMASVIEKRANGTLPIENQGLPWGEWMEGLEGVAIAYNGKEYVRLYPQYLVKPIVHYYANGTEMSKDELLESGLVNKSTFNKPQSDCMTVKTTSIVSIG